MYFANRKLIFAPPLWPSIAAMVFMALTLHLAFWQRDRAAEKRKLQAEFDQRVASAPVLVDALSRDFDQLRFRRAIARGEWLEKQQIFLDNKTDGGPAGYHVITPLQLVGTRTFILVNRGWIARGPRYPVTPVAPAPVGVVEVEGVLSIPSNKFLELAAEVNESSVWQNLTIDRYRKQKGIDVLPVVMLESATKPAGSSSLLKLTEHPDAGVDKHIEYMLTWFSLAATIVALWISLNLKMIQIDSDSMTSARKAP
jgi:surfeit locus 1 family protein